MKNKNTPKNGNTENTLDNRQGDIRTAIESIEQARSCIADFCKERAGKQLSVSALSVINRDLQDIRRRLAVYDKD